MAIKAVPINPYELGHQALNRPVALGATRAGDGVMMIPIPRRGIYQGTRNLEGAFQRAGISGIRITAQRKQIIAPPPGDGSDLGFIFSRCASSSEVELALRLEHALQERAVAGPFRR